MCKISSTAKYLVDTFQPTISVATVATRNPPEIHIAHCTQQQIEKKKNS